VTKNGPLARLCLFSLMYLIAQNVVGAIVIYYARDYLDSSAALLTLVTIITTGAVLTSARSARGSRRAWARRGGS